MKISRLIGAVVISLVLALPLPGVAYAESDGVPSAAAEDSDVSALIVELVERNPGTSSVEMEQAVKDAALATGASETEVAREALSEAGDPPGFVQIQPRSGSKPKANKKIGTARNRGDVFYTPSSTAGVNHGHSGIYSYTTKIVEADPSTGVTERWLHPLRWHRELANSMFPLVKQTVTKPLTERAHIGGVVTTIISRLTKPRMGL